MFIDKQEHAGLPYLERNAWWLKFFAGCVTVSAVLEFFSTSIYATIFFLDTNLGKYEILTYIFRAVLIIASIIGTLWIVGAQRVAIRKFVGAKGTQSVWDDLFYLLGIVLITVILIYVGNKGDKLILHGVNSYEPKIGEYSKDNDYVEKKDSKKDLSMQKEQAIKNANQSVVDCSECKIIEGRYKGKIAAKKAKKITRFKANEVNWAMSVNSKIASEANALEEEMNGKIIEARGRAELKRDSIIASYDKRLFSADTSLVVHQLKIDSANKKELPIKDEVQQSNNLFAGLLVLLTQFLCLLGAGGQSYMYRKDGKVWHDIEKALSASDFVTPIMVVINVKLGRVAEWIKLWVSNFVANERVAVSEMKEKAFEKNELTRVMYEAGVTNLKQAEYFINKAQNKAEQPTESLPQEDIEPPNDENIETENDEKKNEIIEENEENVIKNDRTLQKNTDLIQRLKNIIEDCDIALEVITDENVRSKFNLIIEDCNIALEIL